jgi:putative aminopeptidase FrvX
MHNKSYLSAFSSYVLRGVAIGIASPCLVGAQERDTAEVDLLKELVAVPGVSGREEQIREVIQMRLPRWARDASRVDAIGNLIVTVGSGEPSILYVAHMDEIGYWVTNIRGDGRIQVQTTGGFYDRQYEGRVVQIHTRGGPINGVVAIPSIHLQGPAPAPETRPFNVDSVVVDVGTESRDETVALGIELLDPITVPKDLTQLAGTRLAARSMDDRFGCAALLALARRIDPNAINGTLTIAWSVQEELGLQGARALASAMSPDVVVAIDTYVASDSAVENARLGNAKLGEGPVIRALDTSNVAPIARVRALMSLAERRQLRLRYGATGGGNDGSVFRTASSEVLPIGIPLRYSHSAVETIDTRDLAGLVDLLEAMVRDTSWTN